MQRALMWLNLYGHQGVKYKLKNWLKKFFVCVFSPFLSSRRTSWRPYLDEPNWCPLCQFILLTQGPIPEIFAKKFLENWGSWNLSFFQAAIFIFFVSFQWKSITTYELALMGLNVYDYYGFQHKITPETQCMYWFNIDFKILIYGRFQK